MFDSLARVGDVGVTGGSAGSTQCVSQIAVSMNKEMAVGIGVQLFLKSSRNQGSFNPMCLYYIRTGISSNIGSLVIGYQCHESVACSTNEH